MFLVPYDFFANRPDENPTLPRVGTVCGQRTQFPRTKFFAFPPNTVPRNDLYPPT